MPTIYSTETSSGGGVSATRVTYTDGTGYYIHSGNTGFWTGTFSGPAPGVPASAPAAVSGVNPVETTYSLYGHNIPLSVFGVGRIGGDIIVGPWVDNGNASFIISFGVPADPSGTRDLREIAFDSEVVWTAAGGFSTEPFTYKFYGGTLTQAADPLETSHFGADAVAYRPQILLAFDNLPLAGTKFKKIPYVSAVFGDATGDDVNLGEAFERLAYSPWVGWTSDQFETAGITDGLVNGGLIIVESAEFLATIQQFGRFYPNWDILQTDKLRVVDRGSNVTADITLDKTTLMGEVSFSRQEPNSVPRELVLTTIDPGADYTLLPSTAKRPRDPVNVTSSVRVDTAYLPAIMDSSFRQAIATYALYHEEQARKKISLTAMLFGLEIEPGDLVAVTGLGDDFHDEVFKIVATTHGANYAVEIQAEAILKCEITGSYSPTAPGALAQFAVSRSRILVPGYAGPLDAVDGPSGKVTTWYDQSGYSRDLVGGGGTGGSPAAITSGPNSRACCDFAPPDIANPHIMHTVTSSTPPDLISDIITPSTGYIVMSIRPDAVTQNWIDGVGDPTAHHLCAGVLNGGGSTMGISMRSTGVCHAYNNDGSGSVNYLGGTPDHCDISAPIAGNPFVVEWWHADGFLNQRINGAGLTSVVSGDSIDISSTALILGYGGSTGSEYDGKIFECMIFNPVPSLPERNAIVADMMDWVGA